MKKIIVTVIRFSYEHLRNEAHVEFHTMVNSLVVRFNPETLGINPLYLRYRPLYEEEVTALDQILKSGITPEIEAFGRDRDSLYRGFVDNVKSNLHHFDPGKRKAAAKLVVILDHYGNIARKTLIDETAAIEDLYRELTKQETHVHVAALGLGDWLDQLVQASRNLEALMMSRYNEAAKRPNIHMRSIRREVDRVFRGILDLLEALMRIKGEDTDREFISELNAVSERYKDILAQGAGRRHPVKDLSKGDHCVVEPVDTQQYAGKAVTPIPKACWREADKPTVELVFAKDFSVTYRNNVKVGTADVIIHGKGNYKGQKTVTFNIAQ
jgi:hypothetical protein